MDHWLDMFRGKSKRQKAKSIMWACAVTGSLVGFESGLIYGYDIFHKVSWPDIVRNHVRLEKELPRGLERASTTYPFILPFARLTQTTFFAAAGGTLGLLVGFSLPLAVPLYLGLQVCNFCKIVISGVLNRHSGPI
jgi:hypothetical protein